MDSVEKESSWGLMSGRRCTSRLACRKWLNPGVLRGVAFGGDCREQSGGKKRTRQGREGLRIWRCLGDGAAVPGNSWWGGGR